MSDEIGTVPGDVPGILDRFKSTGLANHPDDCAAQLAMVSDAMLVTASGMSWVAQYAKGLDQDMRAELMEHARELVGAAKLAKSWADAIVAA